MNATLPQDLLPQYLEIAQREIAFCQNCQPTENGVSVWRFGLRMKLSELLTRLTIPPAHHEYVAESLECNNCGAMLDLTATVGIKTQSERESEQLWRKWEAQYANRFRDLHDFLVEHPSLSLQHRLGRELFKALADFPRLEVALGTYYCARRITSSVPATVADFTPPNCMPEAGQFHHAGQQVFVLADSEAAAACEILRGQEKIVWVQKSQLTRYKGILDLSRHLADSPTPLIEHLIYGLNYRGAPRAGESLDSGATIYRVARFLADCARVHGYNGIRTTSAKHYDNSLILFTWPAEVWEPLGEPYIFDLRTGPASHN